MVRVLNFTLRARSVAWHAVGADTLLWGDYQPGLVLPRAHLLLLLYHSELSDTPVYEPYIRALLFLDML